MGRMKRKKLRGFRFFLVEDESYSLLVSFMVYFLFPLYGMSSSNHLVVRVDLPKPT